MKRSVSKGILTGGGLHIPVSVYQSIEPFRIRGHLYHQDCGGKIRQLRFCEIHGMEDESPPIFNAIPVDEGAVVPITSEDRNILLDRKNVEFKIVGAYPVSMISMLMQSNDFAMIGTYEMIPQKIDTFLTDPQEELFASLISSLQTKKRMLLVKIPVVGMVRFCLLMAGDDSARIYPLLYREELRDPEILNAEPTASSKQKTNAILKKLERKTMPQFSCQPIIDRVNDWIMSAISAGKPKKKIGALSQRKEKVLR